MSVELYCITLTGVSIFSQFSTQTEQFKGGFTSGLWNGTDFESREEEPLHFSYRLFKF